MIVLLSGGWNVKQRNTSLVRWWYDGFPVSCCWHWNIPKDSMLSDGTSISPAASECAENNVSAPTPGKNISPRHQDIGKLSSQGSVSVVHVLCQRKDCRRLLSLPDQGNYVTCASLHGRKSNHEQYKSIVYLPHQPAQPPPIAPPTQDKLIIFHLVLNANGILYDFITACRCVCVLHIPLKGVSKESEQTLNKGGNACWTGEGSQRLWTLEMNIIWYIDDNKLIIEL